MGVDERSRHRLYERLEEVLGPEEATILMEHLPPGGWGEVATKHDLDVLHRDIGALRAEVAFKKDLEAMENRLTAAFRAELLQQTRTFMLTSLSFAVGVAGLVFAAVRLS